MSLRPIPATNRGPRVERLGVSELEPDALRNVFYGFSALMSTWWSEEDEKMIELVVGGALDEEERGL